ncbi:hypothetical protein [Nocardia salmonicida]|uniref:hypothetical protein n=1 Tax=Nocardia salmonicida TaxID=53431 RepID=UPI002E2C9838|nr:hypothetical protein [Nocardia salmonicida]
MTGRTVTVVTPEVEPTISRSELVILLRLAEASGQNYLIQFGTDHASRHLALTARWDNLLAALGISHSELAL